ncbi:MAG TPA: hypothetical protein VL947_10240 [Cytophagales bacterium]|nr:hypothetical protein [Cytophagales bacterium]
MKNITTIIFLTIAGILGAQNTKITEAELLGTWKITKVEIDNVITAEKGKNPDLADTTNTKSQEFINSLAKSISDEYLNSKFYFKSQNRLKIKSKRKVIKCVYHIEGDGAYIVTDVDFFKRLAVQKLENNVMVINQVDDNKVINLTLTKK